MQGWLIIVLILIFSVVALGTVTPVFGFESAQIQPAQVEQPQGINWWDLGIAIAKTLWYVLF